MFAVYRFTLVEPSREQVEQFGREWFFRTQAQDLENTAKVQLRLYSSHRPEYQNGNQVEAVQFPDRRYNYNQEHLTIRAYLLTEDDTLFGVPFRKEEGAVFVNLDELPDSRFLDQLTYLYGQEPVVYERDLDWNATEPAEDNPVASL